MAIRNIEIRLYGLVVSESVDTDPTVIKNIKYSYPFVEGGGVFCCFVVVVVGWLFCFFTSVCFDSLWTEIFFIQLHVRLLRRQQRERRNCHNQECRGDAWCNG